MDFEVIMKWINGDYLRDKTVFLGGKDSAMKKIR